MSDTRSQILITLSDAKFHAGTDLARTLAISRAAVWKHIRHLREQGAAIEAVPGKGYRLSSPLSLLDKKQIAQYLGSETLEQISLYVLQQVDSTNDWLNERGSGLNAGDVCLAEQQTAGRGTRGRQWLSPLGANLYLSICWRFQRTPAEMFGLGLALAINVVETLNETGVEVAIKWPNDIVTQRGKLGGILIDLSGEVNGDSQVIIGLGLNCGMDQARQQQVDQPIDDLSWYPDKDSSDRNQLAASMIKALTVACQDYNKYGFEHFRESWPHWDSLYQSKVTLTTSQQQLQGIAQGIDATGALLLEQDGVRHAYTSGDVSVRVAS